MEEKTNTLNKNRLSHGEIVLMIILSPLIFCIIFAASSFISLFVSGGTNSGIWLWGPIGLIMMFGFFVGWVLLIRKLFNKYKKTEILFMTAGLAILTSFLILWVWAKINTHHMFG